MPERSISMVLQDIIGNVQEIVRSEVHLAKTEMGAEARKAAMASVTLAVGIIVGLYAAGFLFLTIVRALELLLPPWLAALFVAVLLAAVASLMVSAGLKRFQKVKTTPQKTFETMKENVQWATHHSK